MLSLPARRPHRLALAATVLVTLLAAVLGFALSHDDQAPRITTTAVGSSADLEQAAQARDIVEATLAPTKKTSGTLIVPAQGDWWTLLTALAPTLKLNPNDIPDGARWLAYSSGRSLSDTAPGVPEFTAIYVGFDTPDDAAAYSPKCECYNTVRANVAQLIDLYADPDQESYTQFYDTLDPDSLTTSVGAWRINLTDLVRNTIESSMFPQAHTDMFATLGIDPEAKNDVIWEATSTTPEGPWTGKLTGYDLETIDILALGEAVADSTTYRCAEGTNPLNGSGCDIVDTGFVDVGSFFFLNAGQYSFGNRELDTPGAGEILPENLIARGGLDPQYYEGALTHNGYTRPSALKHVWFELTRDFELSLRFEFED